MTSFRPAFRDEPVPAFDRPGTLADGVAAAPLGRKLRFLLRAAFPPQDHMAAYMHQFHKRPLTGLRRWTCYVTRALDLSSKAFWFFGYSLTHRPEATRQIAQIKRQAQLWKWVAEEKAES